MQNLLYSTYTIIKQCILFNLLPAYRTVGRIKRGNSSLSILILVLHLMLSILFLLLHLLLKMPLRTYIVWSHQHQRSVNLPRILNSILHFMGVILMMIITRIPYRSVSTPFVIFYTYKKSLPSYCIFTQLYSAYT